MKKVLIAGVVIVAVVLIFIGNSTWNQKVEKTVKEAEERISEPSNKESNMEKEDSDNSNTDSAPTTTDSTKNNDTNQPIENVAADTFNKTTNEEPAEESSKAAASNDSVSSNNEAKKHTVEEIKAAYYPLFQELEAQETSKIDQLVVQAKADFLSSNAPASEILQKYEQIASGMEQNADRAFNALYQELQYDLEKNGHSKAEAEEFRQTYNAKKQARLQRIVDQMGSF